MINLSNLCNFQLFASIMQAVLTEVYQPSKTANLLGGKKINEPLDTFFEKILTETIRYTKLKFSEITCYAPSTIRGFVNFIR